MFQKLRLRRVVSPAEKLQVATQATHPVAPDGNQHIMPIIQRYDWLHYPCNMPSLQTALPAVTAKNTKVRQVAGRRLLLAIQVEFPTSDKLIKRQIVSHRLR